VELVKQLRRKHAVQPCTLQQKRHGVVMHHCHDPELFPGPEGIATEVTPPRIIDLALIAKCMRYGMKALPFVCQEQERRNFTPWPTLQAAIYNDAVRQLCQATYVI
jgi:hypothetical protein